MLGYLLFFFNKYVGVRDGCIEGVSVKISRTAISADLGGSRR